MCLFISSSIQIHPNYEKNVFNGLVNINVNVSEVTNEIVFHLDGIQVVQEKLFVRSLNRSDAQVKIKENDYIDGQRYRIVLNDELNVNEHYQLTIGYEGKLNEQLQGFYGSEYTDGAFAGAQYVANVVFVTHFFSFPFLGTFTVHSFHRLTLGKRSLALMSRLLRPLSVLRSLGRDIYDRYPICRY